MTSAERLPTKQIVEREAREFAHVFHTDRDALYRWLAGNLELVDVPTDDDGQLPPDRVAVVLLLGFGPEAHQIRKDQDARERHNAARRAKYAADKDAS